jgi:hypothetical protein
MAAQYTVGEVLPSGAQVIADTFTTEADGTTAEVVQSQYAPVTGVDGKGNVIPGGGGVDTYIITTPGAGTPAANYTTLASRAQAAIVNNVTFISTAATVTFPLTSAEQQALVNQVVALTKQVNALAKITLNLLTDTTGT